MSVRIRDIDRVIEDVKRMLPVYLNQHGFEQNKQHRFRCPNYTAHKNGDKNPSAAFVPNTQETIWHCFACGERGTIFHAASLVEDLPIRGVGFTETLIQLADEFEVSWEEDMDAVEAISAYESATQIIRRGREAFEARNYIAQRQLDSVADHFELGYVNYEKLLPMLERMYEPKFLDQVGLTKRDLLHDRLVFPIRDENGQVVAFGSRRIRDEDPRAKYINSAASRLYEKRKVLYHLNAIDGDEVWVVEGYADVWTMTAYGLPAVAICGTAFTSEHLGLLINRGMKKVHFALDGDFAGQEATKKILPMLENQLDVRVSYVVLPAKDDEKDPDAFIRKYGVEAFLELPQKQLESPIKRELMKFHDRIFEYNESVWENQQSGYQIPAWKFLNEQMNGFQKGMYLVGGLSNIGKTHWMLNWLKEMAKANPDVYTLFFSIDDNLPKVIPRLIASESRLSINTVANPSKYIVEEFAKNKKVQSELMEKREMALQTIKDIAKRNLTVKDDSDGYTLEYIEKTVALYKEITGKNLTVFIDNFHKIRVKQMFRSSTEKFTFLSEEIKRITNQYGLLVGATVELRKLNHKGEPELDDIKDSGDIIYDADVVFMLHNDLHSKGESPFIFKDLGNTYPILQVSVKKNKLSSFKGTDYFRLYPEFSLVKECEGFERMQFEELRKSQQTKRGD